MNQLTITITPHGQHDDLAQSTRLLRGQRGADTQIATGHRLFDQGLAEWVVWRKDDQPWFPHVLGMSQHMGDLPLGKVFMAMAAKAKLPDEDQRRRLHAVCEGLGVDRARMMATGLSPVEAELQRAVLALLSPNPDVVIFSESDAQRLMLLQRLAEDYSPVPKAFWLMGDRADDASGEPVGFRWQVHAESSPLLEEPALGSAAAGRGLGVTESVTQPGLAVYSADEPPAALDKKLGQELADATIVHITGTDATGNARMTYDLSAAVGPDTSGEVVVWVATRQPVQLIWGCLSRHRRPPPAKVTLVVDEGGDAAWLAMAASSEVDESMALTARIGTEGRLAVTHASPAGLPPLFEQGLDLAEGAKVTLYSLAFCDQSSETRASPAQRAGIEAHRVRLAFRSGPLRTVEGAERAVNAPAAYALLQSVQVEDPCTALLNCAVTWFEAQLPMEYRVDLITLLESILRRP